MSVSITNLFPPYVNIAMTLLIDKKEQERIKYIIRIEYII